MKKLYIVQKYVMARSISEAIKNERDVTPDHIYLDNDWRKANMPEGSENKMGYKK